MEEYKNIHFHYSTKRPSIEEEINEVDFEKNPQENDIRNLPKPLDETLIRKISRDVQKNMKYLDRFEYDINSYGTKIYKIPRDHE